MNPFAMSARKLTAGRKGTKMMWVGASLNIGSGGEANHRGRSIKGGEELHGGKLGCNKVECK